jgi:hypothetical protein
MSLATTSSTGRAAFFLTLLRGLAVAVAAAAAAGPEAVAVADAPPSRLGSSHWQSNGNGARAASSAASSAASWPLARTTESTTRQLQKVPYVVGFAGNTTGATPSAGNPVGSCGGSSGCINGCPSEFYKLVAKRNSNDSVWLQVSGCAVRDEGSPDEPFRVRTYVWKGAPNSACGSFTCVGTGRCSMWLS